MSVIKNINTGFSQKTFDFDHSREQDLKKLLAAIDLMIADKDQVLLDHVVSFFYLQSDRWSKMFILNLINDLFKDNKIHFIIDKKKILPENIKTLIFEPDQSKSEFMQAGEIISIVKTHFSESTQWKYIEIIKPEVVEESVLLSTQHLGEKLFKNAGPVGQNSLYQNIRRHLRMWKSDLEEFRKVAGTGNYPGINKIQKGLDLLNKLLNVPDPCKFIEIFLNNEDQLCDASSHFVILKHFYENQIHIWNALIKAVDVFKPNRMLIEKDPDAAKALETLHNILKKTKPYSMIKEIRSLISIVKIVNDPIVEEQIASAKALAVEKIEKKIDKIIKILEEKKTNNDTRNKMLFPLQTSKKKINMASSIQTIGDYLNGQWFNSIMP